MLWVLIAGAAVVCLVGYLWHSGAFHTVEISVGAPPMGEAVIAYKFDRGHYKNTRVLFKEVVKLAPQNKCLGIYYDDPKVVPEEKLRYAVGSVLAEGDAKVDKGLQDMMVASGYKITHLPSVANVVKATFPATGFLSNIFAVMKVYPKMTAYITEKKLDARPFIDVCHDGVMHVIAPLSKQDQFIVEEADDPEEMEQYNS